MSLYPWTSCQEWNDVYEWLYSSDTEHQRKGVARVQRSLRVYVHVFLSLIHFLSLSLLPIGSGVEGAWCGSRAAGGDGRHGVLPGARARVFQQPGLQRAGAAPHICYGPNQVWYVAPVHGKCCTPVIMCLVVFSFVRTASYAARSQ